MTMIDHGGHGEAQTLKDCNESPIDFVLTCVTNVHRNLGPGLLVSVYELAAMLEFEQAHIPAKPGGNSGVLPRSRSRDWL